MEIPRFARNDNALDGDARACDFQTRGVVNRSSPADRGLSFLWAGKLRASRERSEECLAENTWPSEKIACGFREPCCKERDLWCERSVDRRFAGRLTIQ